MRKKKKRGPNIFLVIVIILLLAILGFFVWKAMQKSDFVYNKITNIKASCPESAVSPKEKVIVTATQKIVAEQGETAGSPAEEGAAGEASRQCNEYNLNEMFRKKFGNPFMDERKARCEAINPSVWTENIKEVSCLYKEFGIINCAENALSSIKVFCESLNAEWQCKEKYYGCTCKEQEEPSGPSPEPGADEIEPPVETEISCKEAPPVDVSNWKKCLEYKCPEGNECAWQVHLGKCGCQSKTECGYHVVDGQEKCYGDCDVGVCTDYLNEYSGLYHCECIAGP